MIAMAALLCAFALSGCGPKPEPKPEPKIAPPAIRAAGVLKVGVDLELAPFGATVKPPADAKPETPDRQVGLDVDAASALAEKLGLTVQFVDVKPSEAATALAKGTVDVVFSVPFDGTAPSDITVAGTYLDDAPALFVSTGTTAAIEPSMTLDTIPTFPVTAQQGSVAYWQLVYELGEESVNTVATLREGFQLLESGDAQVIAGDAIVGAYIGRDFPTVHLAGQIAPTAPLGVAVLAENGKLSDAVRNALDELAADGVLDQIRRTWVGSFPALAAPSAEESATP